MGRIRVILICTIVASPSVGFEGIMGEEGSLVEDREDHAERPLLGNRVGDRQNSAVVQLAPAFVVLDGRNLGSYYRQVKSFAALPDLAS